MDEDYDEGYWVRKIDEYREIRRENNLINIFLTKYLDIDEETASTDAYDLKRSLSYSTFAKLKKFIYFLENRIDGCDFNIPKEVEEFQKNIFFMTF
jgi:Mn-dependent DtxR family transcriptional regulator